MHRCSLPSEPSVADSVQPRMVVMVVQSCHRPECMGDRHYKKPWWKADKEGCCGLYLRYRLADCLQLVIPDLSM